MVGDRYFFEIAIYRVSFERFDAQYKKDLAKEWRRFEQSGGISREESPENIRNELEYHFWENYGGPWYYNQVIGWIRLFVVGSQILGQQWQMTGKRYHRKTRNQYRFIDDVFVLDCWPEQSSEDIASELEKQLEHMEKGMCKRGWVLDLECFRTLLPCVNWRKLVGSNE